MAETPKKYATYGMTVKCSAGTMENYISTDVGHGVNYQGKPILNANDHVKGVNLTHFGDCRAEGMKVIKEALGLCKCELDVPEPWQNTNEKHILDGAPALTVDSICTCRYGGVISFVKEATTVTVGSQVVNAVKGLKDKAGKEMEMEDAVEDAEEAGEIPKASIEKYDVPVVGATAVKGEMKSMAEYLEKSIKSTRGRKEQVEQKKMNQPYKNFLPEGQGLLEIVKRHYISKYVNEETLKKINANWDIESLKEICGEDVFEHMGDCMYEAGITEEKSILMFLCTLGVESFHGTSAREWAVTEEYLLKENRSYTVNTSGAGLIQVTGYAQKDFLEYLSDNVLEDEFSKDEVKKYISGFETIQRYDEEGEKYDVCTNSMDVTGFIAEKYPIESAVWYWAIYNFKGKDINSFVESMNGAEPYNVYAATQMIVNSTEYSLEALERFCMYENQVSIVPTSECSEQHSTGYCFKVPDEPERHSYGPIGWEKRENEWNKAKKLMDNTDMEEN